MAFVNFSLIFGCLLVAIPIVLHLILRQRPKHYLFPALRFIRERREVNQRKLKLRHWLLLLFRCTAIAVLAAALARPSVRSAVVGEWTLIGCLLVALVLVGLLISAGLAHGVGQKLVIGLSAAAVVLLVALLVVGSRAFSDSRGALIGDRAAPVAAALVFDTSPRMLYQHQNETRLQTARDTALWLLKQLPAESEIAVLESRPDEDRFAVDLIWATQRVKGVETTTVPLPLIHVLDSALQWVGQSEKERKEVYVFTDMTESAWRGDMPTKLRQRLDGADHVQIYVVDVGVDQPQNFALGNIRLSDQVVAGNDEIRIQTDLIRIGPAGEQSIELFLEESGADQPMLVDGKFVEPVARRADRIVCTVDANGIQPIEFHPRFSTAGTYHGRIQITGQDGLGVDNARYFTIQVRPAARLLVATGPGANSRLFTHAVAPLEFRNSGRSQFECTDIDLHALAQQTLDEYDAICLLDPGPLSDTLWRGLADYVRSGGGLAIFLGRNAGKIQSFNREFAQQLLPGQLVRQWRSGGSHWYVVPRYDHVVFDSIRDNKTAVPWPSLPIDRHWELGELATGTSIIADVSNNQHLLLERAVGAGMVLTMTSPVTDPANQAGRAPWNWLPTSLESWPFVVLCNEMMLHLVQRGEGRLNYETGEVATMRHRIGPVPRQYLVATPQGTWEDVRSEGDEVRVRFTELPGTYRVIAKDAAERNGFSVNLSAEKSELARSSQRRLDEILGKDQYRFAQRRAQIVRDQGEARVGRQFYPYLVVLLGLVLGLEQTLANRFYGRGERLEG